MTMVSPVPPTIDSVWPAVASRLRGLLAQRGLPVPAADDIIQEVALRVLLNNVPFGSAAELYPWCATVARRLVIDDYRSRSRRTLVDYPENTAGPSDVAADVESRDQLRRVTDLIGDLSAPDRDLLLRAPGAVPMTNREMVRRHRIRGRLLAALESIFLVVLGLRRRYLHNSTAAGAAVAAAAPVMMLIAFALVPAVGSMADAVREPMTNITTPTQSSAAAADASEPAPARRASARPPAPPPPLRPLVGTEMPTPAGPARVLIEPGSEQEHLVCVKGNPAVADWCWGSATWPPHPAAPPLPSPR